MDESYRSIEDENKFVNTTLNLPLLLDNQITLKVYMFMKDMNNTFIVIISKLVDGFMIEFYHRKCFFQ